MRTTKTASSVLVAGRKKVVFFLCVLNGEPFDGRILQQGRHEDLVKVDGLYKTFWNVSQKARKWKLV